MNPSVNDFKGSEGNFDIPVSPQPSNIYTDMNSVWMIVFLCKFAII